MPRPPLLGCATVGPLQGDLITLKVNKLMSVKNLPYEYYSLPYCRPEKIVSSAENLGEVLRGDRIENSPYSVGAAGAGQGGHLDSTAKHASTAKQGKDGWVLDADAARAHWSRPFARLQRASQTDSLQRMCSSPRVQAKFRVNHHCKVLCRIGSLNKAQAKAFKSRISDDYRVNM